MLSNINNTAECYLMVDQDTVYPNSLHRRGGLHVDGYWEGEKYNSDTNTWSTPLPFHGPAHLSSSSRHLDHSNNKNDTQLILLSSNT